MSDQLEEPEKSAAVMLAVWDAAIASRPLVSTRQRMNRCTVEELKKKYPAEADGFGSLLGHVQSEPVDFIAPTYCGIPVNPQPGSVE